MEDRYLFRGKRIDTGKWVEGYFVQTAEGSYIVVPYKASTILGEGSIIEVDASTICQCTGLKDDNNNLIFENDILFLKDKINGIEWKAIVRFGNPNGEYYYGWQLVPIAKIDGNKDILLWVETETEYMKCEVIGNKFDNPELLK